MPRLLLVEDDQINQRVICRMLARFGYVPDIVENGLCAVEAAQRSDYDLILMDIMMPVMDGIEATRRIRAMGSGIRQPKIVAVTANVVPEDRASCFEAGMDDFIAKPIRLEVLEAALENYLPAALPVEEDGPPDAVPEEVGDVATFDALRAGIGYDTEFLNELISEFFRDAGTLIATIRSCAVGGDRRESSRAAHSLKATAGTFGLAALAATAASVDPLLKTGSPDVIFELTLKMTSQLERAHEWMNARSC